MIEAETRARWFRKQAAAEEGGGTKSGTGFVPVTGRHLAELNGGNSKCFAFSPRDHLPKLG